MLLKTVNLTKRFGQKQALNEVNVELECGHVYGFLGPNGSGKSTFMKLVAGLFRTNKGEILFEDNKINIKAKQSIAYMTTEPFLYEHLTIKQVGKYYMDFFDDFSMEEYERLLEYMELDQKLLVKSLSSGMHSKLKIAVTMSRNAKLIMLDEPLNGIDIVAREQILKAIRQKANANNCILISSHLVNEMEVLLTDTYFIKNGNIVLKGSIKEIYEMNNKNLVEMYKEVYARHV